MKKKALFLNKSRVNKELLEVEKLQGYTNELFILLQKFGVTDPEAIQNPIAAVEEQLRDSMPSGSVQIPIANILKLVNKEKEYRNIIRIANFVGGHKYLNYLIFANNYFSIQPTVEQMITEAMTPYLTDANQIELATRIEKCIDEVYDLADILGISLGYLVADFLRLFGANRVEGKTILSPGDKLSKISFPTSQRIEK